MKYKILENSFLGNPLHKKKEYIIIGAGFSGLITAYWLKKNGIKFRIIEKNDRVGGILGSKVKEHGLAEQAANGFIWTPELQTLVDDLGLTLLEPNSASKARFILRNNKLEKFPLSYLEAAKVLLKVIKPSSEIYTTLADFGYDNFGETFSHQMMEPGMAGIYAADLNLLSFPGSMTQLAKTLNSTSFLPSAFYKMKKQVESNKKSSAGTHSFKGGMQELINALEDHLKAYIEFNTDGKDFRKSKYNLILTLPANKAKRFFYGQMLEMLDNVEYLPMISMTFFFKKSSLKRFKEGFGCLIPRNESYRILGILFNSCIFENRVDDPKNISLTCIFRDLDKSLMALPDDILKHMMLKELDLIFGVKEDPMSYEIFRWPQGIPLYSPGLYRSWFKMDRLLQEKFSNINLFGNYTGEISLRGMTQTIFKNIPIG